MPTWKTSAETAEAVVSRIESGMNVFVHGAAATPTPLLDALARRTDLRDVRLWHLHLEGPLAFTAAEHAQGAGMQDAGFRSPACSGSDGRLGQLLAERHIEAPKGRRSASVMNISIAGQIGVKPQQRQPHRVGGFYTGDR